MEKGRSGAMLIDDSVLILNRRARVVDERGCVLNSCLGEGQEGRLEYIDMHSFRSFGLLLGLRPLAVSDNGYWSLPSSWW